ncbi:preprotein translocase subunit SecE [Sporosalibacterium faouarense]|uniref:preprotein translocase subunit SecE n=1 Tax=Sporosalibacterium faouarense TaxID=516123 RepID=UPI00141D6C52|nr:preprotein translocase subunit SecE [Sporosalibacterium faouarense]MTI48351.1 preprotein translocase subunit SecE [Bacillota bacterium]
MAAQSSSNKGGVKRIGNFFKSTRAELKKVSWPNKKELINYTIVVFAVCALISFVVWLLDTGFHELLQVIV